MQYRKKIYFTRVIVTLALSCIKLHTRKINFFPLVAQYILFSTSGLQSAFYCPL